MPSLLHTAIWASLMSGLLRDEMQSQRHQTGKASQESPSPSHYSRKDSTYLKRQCLLSNSSELLSEDISRLFSKTIGTKCSFYPLFNIQLKHLLKYIQPISLFSIPYNILLIDYVFKEISLALKHPFCELPHPSSLTYQPHSEAIMIKSLGRL